MKPGICPQDMVYDKYMRVPQVLYCLDILSDCPRVSSNLGLGKDNSHLHDQPSNVCLSSYEVSFAT